MATVTVRVMATTRPIVPIILRVVPSPPLPSARAPPDIAMAAAPETDDHGQTQIRTQPVFCLMKIELSESLVKFTHTGGRKIDAWTAQHNTVVVPFDTPSDDPLAFANVNTLTELQALENAAP